MVQMCRSHMRHGVLMHQLKFIYVTVLKHLNALYIQYGTLNTIDCISKMAKELVTS